MRFVAATIAFASVASALPPASFKTILNQPSAKPLAPVEAPSNVCEVGTVTIYETAYAKPTQSGIEATALSSLKGTSSRYETLPTAKVPKPSGQKDEYFNFDSGEDVKMQPCTHWGHNTNDPKYLLPGGSKQLYYAEGGLNNAKPNNEFYFGTIDLFFKAPAVVLEQSSYVNKVSYTSNKLVVDFSSAYACDFAKESWTEGTIIVSSTAGCKTSSDDDHCYFKVDDVIISDDNKSITVSGFPQARDECIEGGEAKWGRYKPQRNSSSNRTQPGSSSSFGGFPTQYPKSGSNHFSDVTATGGFVPQVTARVNNTVSGTNTTAVAWSSDSPMPTALGSEKFQASSAEKSKCKAPIDTKYGLTTACTNEFFDLELDELIGYGGLSPEDAMFVKSAMVGSSSHAVTSLTRRALMYRRNLERRNFEDFWRSLKNTVSFSSIDALKMTAEVGLAILKGGIELVTQGTLTGSIKESFEFTLPGDIKNDIELVESPWGPAALVAAYKTESDVTAEDALVDGYVNIYCVDCGAQGRVEVAGTAVWDVSKGITKGELEAWADLRVAMKVGVDAQIKLTYEWKKPLYQQGLPSLSFGIITIGPSVRVNSRVSLEAGAEGRILAGAEMNWNRAYVKVDLNDPSKSTHQNFDPVGRPILGSEGSLSIGAELGLPVGLHFGISIASWSKTVGLINEPMIKGIAKATANVELTDGKITTGFTAIEGCNGIHANLSWRNKLTCNVLDLKEYTLLDTDYKSIQSVCIPIGQPMSISGDLPADSMKLGAERIKPVLSEEKTISNARTHSSDFTKLIAGDFNVMYCPNGNMYVKETTQLPGLGCDDLFASSEESVVGDTQGRYFYYHNNAMKATGVSRLRLGNKKAPVQGTSAIALAAWSASETATTLDADIEGLLVIADLAINELYFLSFCTYIDGSSPKVFIVANFNAGLAVLESGDVKYSITGGDVDKCYPLMASEGHALMDTWS